MKIHRCQWLVAALLCVAGASTVRGQGNYYLDNNTQNVTLSEASFSDLMRRLDDLEAAVRGNTQDDAVCKEVEVLSKPTQKWSGRVHFDYWPIPDESPFINFLETGDSGTAPPDFIGFRRLRFGVAGQVNETMEYKIEMEFAAPDALAFKDAYMGWNELPFLQTVLLGNQKRPYGLDHLNSSRYNVFMERPFVVEAYNQDARRIGVESYGVSEEERWNWRYGVFLMNDLQTTGNQRSDNYQPEVAGRLASTVWYDDTSDGRGYAHLAVAGSLAFPGGGPAGRFRTRPEARTANRWIDTGNLLADSYQLLALESVLNIGAFSLVGEYQVSEVERNAGDTLRFEGGYFYVAYFLTGEHTPWERASGTLGRTKPFENFFLVRNCNGGCDWGWGAWQVAARYSRGDFVDEDIFGGIGDAVTFGLNWWWNPNARVQFNYINGEITDRLAAGTGGSYDIFGTRFMCDF